MLPTTKPDTSEANKFNQLVHLIKKCKELELTTFVASWQTTGAGCGVKVLHVPSRKTVVCEKYKNQYQNAQSAIETLMKSESELKDLIGVDPIPKVGDDIEWDNMRPVGGEFDANKHKNGKLVEYFEPGMEGVSCALQRDDLAGYEGLEVLHEGDFITIYDPIPKVGDDI